ncbi:2OG-Fe(II) oxygenase [Methylobacterium sp. A54F]
MNAQTPTLPAAAPLSPGDPFPQVAPRTQGRPRFAIDTLAGRYIVLCFHGSAADPAGRAALHAVLAHRDRFDDVRASVFAVSVDPADESEGRVRDLMPGVRFVFDFDGGLSRRCGALTGGPEGEPRPYRQSWMVVDPTLHVAATFPLTEDGTAAVFAYLDGLPAPAAYAGFEIPAPVLLLPNVFEPGLCRHLIGLYDAEDRAESGVMRGGVGVIDAGFKKRRDYMVEDPALMREIQARIMRRVVPEIERLFFMRITRMERYLVGCYAAEDGGHFSPHRDNTQGITAHRRFAVSINLSGDFDGGAVSFPEYNLRGYKAPPGWAVIFPCNILHAVGRVTRGRRYAFLPFVYDDAGARIRAAGLAQGAGQEPAEVPAEVPAAVPAQPQGIAGTAA